MSPTDDPTRPQGAAPRSEFVWVDHRGPTTVATPQQVEQLDRDGYFVLEHAFHPDTMSEVMRALALEAGTIELALPAVASDDAPSDVLRRFCSHPLLAGLARDFIGPDARVFADHAVTQADPHDRAPTPFTQDVRAGQAEPTQFLTCWVALTDADTASGCLQIAATRHRRGVLTYDLAEQPATSADVDPAVIVDVEAPAGSVVVMSSLTPRRLRPSESEPPALVYAIQYVNDSVVTVDDDLALTHPRRQFPVVRGGQLVGPS